MALVHLNRAEIGRILKDEMREPIKFLAIQIAENVDVGDVKDAVVDVQLVETDRAHANISIKHPAGMAMEAKHGTLRKAAARVGLKVRNQKKGSHNEDPSPTA